MKKRTLLFLLLALVLSLAGCKKEEEPVEVSSLAVIEPESTEEFVKIDNNIPIYCEA